jgi:malonyl-CoA O-methyltransferase
MDNITGYNRWAPLYDAYPNPTVAIDEMHVPALYRAYRGLKILEIGCGSGRHTARLVTQQNYVLAMDASPGMLALARRKIASSYACFLEGDALSFEPPQQSSWGTPFDVVFESLVLEHVSDLPALCRRVSQWLRPGGIFITSEIHPMRAASGIRAHFADEAGEEVTLNSIAHPRDALVDAARDAGLTCITQLTVRGDTALTALNPKWERYEDLPMIEICRFLKN